MADNSINDGFGRTPTEEMLERAETVEAIRQGLEDIKAGRTLSLEEFEHEMRTAIREIECSRNTTAP